MSSHAIFVTNLEQRRQRVGLTKNEVISRSGIGTSTFYEILRGDVSPTLQTVEALAAAVGATLYELFAPPAPRGFRTITVALPAPIAATVEEDARRYRAAAPK